MRCPVYDDGTHRAVEQEYDPPQCGYVARCLCGHRFLLFTDEMVHLTAQPEGTPT